MIGSRRGVAYLVLWLLLLGVILWRRAPEIPVQVEPGPRETPAFRLDLNADPWPRFLLLEGIGETLARRIVQAREKRGGFSSLEEVMALPGIPDRPFEEARDWVTVGPRPR